MPARKHEVVAKRRITSLADLVATFRAQPTEPQTYETRRRGGVATLVLLQERDVLHGSATGRIVLREFGSAAGVVVGYDLVEDARAIGLSIGAVTYTSVNSFQAEGVWRTPTTPERMIQS